MQRFWLVTSVRIKEFLVCPRGNALRVLALILAPAFGICCDLSATVEAKVPV
jgi:hypothetical protein